MDFSIPPPTRALLDKMRAFLDQEVLPRELDFLQRGFAAIEPELKTVREKAKAAGMWLPQAPKELGGLGLSLVEHGLVSEVLGRSPLSHYAFGCEAPDAGNLEIL